jgi:hypothetical protein
MVGTYESLWQNLWLISCAPPAHLVSELINRRLSIIRKQDFQEISNVCKASRFFFTTETRRHRGCTEIFTSYLL